MTPGPVKSPPVHFSSQRRIAVLISGADLKGPTTGLTRDSVPPRDALRGYLAGFKSLGRPQLMLRRPSPPARGLTDPENFYCRHFLRSPPHRGLPDPAQSATRALSLLFAGWRAVCVQVEQSPPCNSAVFRAAVPRRRRRRRGRGGGPLTQLFDEDFALVAQQLVVEDLDALLYSRARSQTIREALRRGQHKFNRTS